MRDKLKSAEIYAKEIFGERERLSGETVYSHINKVKNLLIDIGVQDENILTAALFHHVISEHLTQYLGEIESRFGHEVREILNHFDKISNLHIKIDSPNNLNKEYIIQTYMNLSNDLNVLLILLADKVEGSKTLYALDPVKRKDSANRCLNIYAPICRLVGLSKFAGVIEKNGFQTLYPSEYFKIKKMLKEKSVITNNYLKNVKDLIQEYLTKNKINSKVTYRIKSEYSIFNKFLNYKEKRKNIKDYSEIKDIAALRIIVDTVEQCYVVESLLKRSWDSVEEERDDYITNPKPTGYKSLHNVFELENDLTLEIQIRTKEMHEYNEFGNASHIFYKYGGKFKDYLKENPDLLKTLNFKRAEEISELQHFSNMVYAFTPKGDIIELPRGASVLDFAYEIHEDLGNRCVGAFVNDDIKKLSHKIEDGDKVEIKMTNKPKVSRDWLDYVSTHKAKKCIRRVLKLENEE